MGRSKSEVLLAVLTALLVLASFGSVVLWWLEREAELARYSFNRALYATLTKSTDFELCHDPSFKDVGYCRDHEELEGRLTRFFNRAGNSIEDQHFWTVPGSFFFILGSSVGYAAQGAPQTTAGQAMTIVFAILSIPLFGIAFITSSNYILQCVEFLFKCFNGSPIGSVEDERVRVYKLGLLSLLVIWPGSAFVFMFLEGWSYPNALYFCYMAFTTVGFGHDVPSWWLSRLVCIVYVYLCLSLLAGIICRLGGLQAEESAPLLPGRLHRPVYGPLACLLVVAFCCFVGMFVFPGLERQEELDRMDRARWMYKYLNNLASFSGCDEELLRRMDFCEGTAEFKTKLKPFFGPNTPNSMVDRELWTELGSASFVLSLASTVGYGATSPHTREGKLATVCMGLIAIPFFIQYMLALASLLRGIAGSGVTKVSLELLHEDKSQKHPILPPLLVALGIWFGGALVFWLLESDSDWGYFTALYFCFVTLSRVGFANVMPNTVAARIFAMVYIVVGLGSVASLLAAVIDKMDAIMGEEEAEAEAA